ncbi:MAG TPA: protein DA1 [Actinophytocola sp.]|uniref:protein DA1 n=1 Tax=Actinophytocola sp. TaxID=1872138 RepID=UPI002DB9FF12|nr:protein DA1 [Actinophytocola sp.]HEU5470199.1 protein DA1 [Actinophytocola sp.]
MAESLRGELTCLSHPVSGHCAFCAAVATNPRGPGWQDVGAGRLRCPGCAAEAVNTVEDVRARLGGIRKELADLGFALHSRVRVLLATAAELSGTPVGRQHGQPLGVTELRPTGGRTADVARIRVLAGLPGTMFGRVIAHELGHAWLAQFGARPLEPTIEEGVCELIAYAWLKRANTPFALALRGQLLTNPDPIYGTGARTVHAATRRHGLETVITSLATSGHLPK